MTTRRIPFSIFAFSLMALLLLGACASPEKFLETGSYDTAIDQALQRLAGKQKKREEWVQVLEAAFAKANARDMEEAERLKRGGRPEDWERVYDIYRLIRYRQAKVEPLLPLVSENGQEAAFRFVRVDDLEQEAREEAAAYLYRDGQRLLDISLRNRDKLAARQALSQLERISRYFRHYRDVEQLMAQAREYGTSYILVEVENRAPVILPAGLEQELLQIGFGNLQSQWRVFHANPEQGRRYDYRVTMKLTNVAVSPGVVNERTFEERCEIQDGFAYVLDERGNVKKDTAGNDIKAPRMVTVRAEVLETYQRKAVGLTGRLEFFDYRTNSLLDVRDLGAEALFEHYASTFRGDERALSPDTRRRIGSRPLPFPPDEVLLLDAARRLKPLIRERLESARTMI